MVSPEFAVSESIFRQIVGRLYNTKDTLQTLTTFYATVARNTSLQYHGGTASTWQSSGSLCATHGSTFNALNTTPIRRYAGDWVILWLQCKLPLTSDTLMYICPYTHLAFIFFLVRTLNRFGFHTSLLRPQSAELREIELS